MKAFRAWAVMTATACVVALTAFGQRMSGSGPRDYGTAEMCKIFGKNQAFTATAEMSVTDPQRPQPIQMETSYAFLKGNVRMEMDMASTKGAGMSPQAVAQMKQMGMDRTVNIYRGDKKLMYLVYPGLKSYCAITPSGLQPSKSEQKQPKIENWPLGKETVDGHPCVKNKITVTADDGSQHEITAWQATDLNDFPIKTEMQAGNATVSTHFRDIKLSAPDASLFNPPSDYKSYASMQELMMANMAHMMPPGGGMPPRGGGQ
jgi:hypothetical protein